MTPYKRWPKKWKRGIHWFIFTFQIRLIKIQHVKMQIKQFNTLIGRLDLLKMLPMNKIINNYTIAILFMVKIMFLKVRMSVYLFEVPHRLHVFIYYAILVGPFEYSATTKFNLVIIFHSTYFKFMDIRYVIEIGKCSTLVLCFWLTYFH